MMAIQHNALDRVASVLVSDHQASSDFDLNPDITLPANRALRDAGVLMLIEERAEGMLRGGKAYWQAREGGEGEGGEKGGECLV